MEPQDSTKSGSVDQLDLIGPGGGRRRGRRRDGDDLDHLRRGDPHDLALGRLEGHRAAVGRERDPAGRLPALQRRDRDIGGGRSGEEQEQGPEEGDGACHNPIIEVAR